MARLKSFNLNLATGRVGANGLAEAFHPKPSDCTDTILTHDRMGVEGQTEAFQLKPSY